MLSIGPDGTMPAVPDGQVPIYKLEGPIARRMIDLQLHRFDLEFVAACLKLLLPHHTPVIEREAIWNAAMVRFFKCYASPAVGGELNFLQQKYFGPNLLPRWCLSSDSKRCATRHSCMMKTPGLRESLVLGLRLIQQPARSLSVSHCST